MTSSAQLTSPPPRACLVIDVPPTLGNPTFAWSTGTIACHLSIQQPASSLPPSSLSRLEPASLASQSTLQSRERETYIESCPVYHAVYSHRTEPTRAAVPTLTGDRLDALFCPSCDSSGRLDQRLPRRHTHDDKPGDIDAAHRISASSLGHPHH